ncbi:anhydro-N-acetylmuramic acid kinase [Deinococcus sp. YIM 134068]|uniref:anhydro-N-acetylmuramic acid kinase n=1 Tax=Deinococcus lichenicola TaxID=3118910 RepID=UPI002F95BD54
MTRAPRLLGLMNGTSVDGIDAVLIELPGWPELDGPGLPPALVGPAPRATVLEHRYTPFADDLRAALLAACRNEARTSDLTQLHFWLGEALAEAAADLAPGADLIASHGQTVHHIPQRDEGRGWHTRSTLQLGEASVIVERTGRPVVSDFRPPDLAAGGQAAPLVPFADRLLYAEAGVRRAVHNLGGISNLTYLPGLSEAGVLAFDTGPANALIDEAAELFRRRYDEGGRLGAAGDVADSLVETWRRDPYLEAPPPKSTGRERWNLRELPGVYELNAPDIAATVTAFSARTIADAYARFVLPLGLDEIVVAGGGAYNPTLMGHLRRLLAPVPVVTFEERGWNSSAREAAAFAVLGYYAYRGWRNTLPGTTGARHAVVAGKLSRPWTDPQ